MLAPIVLLDVLSLIVSNYNFLLAGNSFDLTMLCLTRIASFYTFYFCTRISFCRPSHIQELSDIFCSIPCCLCLSSDWTFSHVSLLYRFFQLSLVNFLNFLSQWSLLLLKSFSFTIACITLLISTLLCYNWFSLSTNNYLSSSLCSLPPLIN